VRPRPAHDCDGLRHGPANVGRYGVRDRERLDHQFDRSRSLDNPIWRSDPIQRRLGRCRRLGLGQGLGGDDGLVHDPGRKRRRVCRRGVLVA
jgi:hypothetical protein